jgi:competence protein ComEC
MQSERLWRNKWVISLFSIPIGIFLLMLPVVHGFFGTVSGWQLLTPLLSLLFVPFYPLAIGLHLMGMGGILDSGLKQLFMLPSAYWEHMLPLWAVAGYGLLSLWAMRNRIALGMTLAVALLYLAYLLVFVKDIA